MKKFFDLPCCLVGRKMVISAGILLDSEEEGIYAAETKKSLNALALQGSHVLCHYQWSNLVPDDAQVPLSLKIYIL